MIVEIKNGGKIVIINICPSTREEITDKRIYDLFVETFNLSPHIHPYYRTDE
jgi:hypothetical protein